MTLRIGINLGDVIVEGDYIYGDGVNVAARIEALAEPGGIAISAPVFEQVRQRLTVGFKDGGAHKVKNIPNPVQVYHLRPDTAPVSEISSKSTTLQASRKKQMIGVAAVLVLMAALTGLWWQSFRPTSQAGDGDGILPLALADKPSVAVLPFANLSGDADQRYFSDGIADNLITDLSHISGLLVIARNTSFSFRDQNEDPRSAAAELGIRYLVEGSVQRAGGQVRINASLIDAGTGLQVWAGRVDREFIDLFALQDEVAAQIVEALQVEMTQEERRLIAKRYSGSLEAYDLYLRAYEGVWRFSEESRRVALGLLSEALKIDPDFALAKSMMASSLTNRNSLELASPSQSLDRAYQLASDAVAFDPDLPLMHSALGLVHLFRREYDLAESSFDRALELDPNFADGYALRAWNWQYAGYPEKALKSLEYAMRLNPRAPIPYLNAHAEIYFSLGNYQAAVDKNAEALERNPTAQRVRLLTIVCLALLGQIEDAEWELEELFLLSPDLKISDLPTIMPYRDQAILDRLIKGARLAGLPE